MNIKNTLAAFALAFFAIGCNDPLNDILNGPGYALVVDGEHVDSWTNKKASMTDKRAGCEKRKGIYAPRVDIHCQYISSGNKVTD